MPNPQYYVVPALGGHIGAKVPWVSAVIDKRGCRFNPPPIIP